MSFLRRIFERRPKPPRRELRAKLPAPLTLAETDSQQQASTTGIDVGEMWEDILRKEFGVESMEQLKTEVTDPLDRAMQGRAPMRLGVRDDGAEIRALELAVGC